MSHRLFFGANTLPDHLLIGEPFARAAGKPRTRVEHGQIEGAVAAVRLNLWFNPVRRQADESAARRSIGDLRDSLVVAPNDSKVVVQAMGSDFANFEGGIQRACAILAAATHLLTRDPTGFRNSALPAIRPDLSLRTISRSG